MTLLEQWQTWPAWAFFLYYFLIGCLGYFSADLFVSFLDWLLPED